MGRRSVEKAQNAWYSSSGTQEDRLGQERLNSQKILQLLNTLANTCTAMIREKQGVMGDVARLIGGSFVAPPIDPINNTALLWGSKRLRGSGRAGHDSRRRGAGECSSVRSRS